MSTAAIDQKTSVSLPTLSYGGEPLSTLASQKATRCWNFCKAPLEFVGRILRNEFFLPLFKKTIDPDFVSNENVATDILRHLNTQHPPFIEKLSPILNHFSIRDINVKIQGPIIRTFTVRQFESKRPIDEKKLRVILFVFNGNIEGKEQAKSVPRKWDPLTMEDLSKSPLAVLEAFKATGIHVDSLVTTSLGTVALDALKYLPPLPTTIPSTLIINRGLTSVKKAASQRFPFPLNYIPYGAAKLCGWDANPEKELQDYLGNILRRPNNTSRKIVMIEAQGDTYFSKKGAPEAKVHEKIAKLGVSVFRAQFWPFLFHSRSHHALSLGQLKNNTETKILANTENWFPMDKNESVASAIAKNIFFEGDKEWHTCFVIPGADATLATGTIREIMDLLLAFMEGKRIARTDKIELSAS